MRAITLSLLLAASVVIPSPSAAQGAGSEDDAWRRLATSLEPGAFITVRTKDGTRLTGTLVQATADGILLKPKTRIPVPARELAFSNIESIERSRQGMKPGLKVLLGTGIGFGVLLLIGALVYAAGGGY